MKKTSCGNTSRQLLNLTIMGLALALAAVLLAKVRPLGPGPPYVSCVHCHSVLSNDSKKGGTSHLCRHAGSCKPPTTSSVKIESYFKTKSNIPRSVKDDLTNRCTEFVCKDMRPFETLAGEGFANLAQFFINIGVKYGQVSGSQLKELLPHPTTASRRVGELYSKVKTDVIAELASHVNENGGGITRDMRTEPFTCTSYITVTVHYVSSDWTVVERVLATREFDPQLSHTGLNIRHTLFGYVVRTERFCPHPVL